MIAIIDYGMGNLRSVQKALEHVGADACVTSSSAEVLAADKVVLPGVGAMKPAMHKLEDLGMLPAITKVVAAGTPFLGICLGFQLLFEASDEGGMTKGLGLLKGHVRRFNAVNKVPHMGWNQLNIRQSGCALYKGVVESTYVYFCHSYYVDTPTTEIIATTTDYGIAFTSSVSKDNIFGLQFHPEKSQKAGLTMLENFAQL